MGSLFSSPNPWVPPQPPIPLGANGTVLTMSGGAPAFLAGPASGSYSNANSGLAATTVQAAIDELDRTVQIDAGRTTDLTAVIAACVAAGTSTLRLRGQKDYTWPASTLLPLGMNISAEGWDGTHAASPGVGSTIHTTDSSILVQALGAARATVIQGVHFKDGVQVRKQRTNFLSCRFDGLIVGDNNNVCSPYFSHFLGCHFDGPDPGGTPIRIQNRCNAVYFDGSLFVSPGGRGIDFQGTAQGNGFHLSQDYGGASSADVQSIVYFNAVAISNDIEFFYWEDSAHTGKFTDGGHIVFGGGATQNRVFIKTSAGDRLRVYHTEDIRDNYVEIQSTRDAAVNNASFNWDWSKPDTVMMGSGASVFLPPLPLRRGALKLLPINPNVTAYAAYRLGGVTPVAINAAGSGGTDGIYYQSVSDGNTVAGHDATVKITVTGGAMTAVALRYPGWWTVSPSTAFAVTVVPGLIGGTLTLGVVRDSPTTSVEAASMPVGTNKLTTFMGDAINAEWRMFPFVP